MGSSDAEGPSAARGSMASDTMLGVSCLLPAASCGLALRSAMVKEPTPLLHLPLPRRSSWGKHSAQVGRAYLSHSAARTKGTPW
jgi:hypothetical protein